MKEGAKPPLTLGKEVDMRQELTREYGTSSLLTANLHSFPGGIRAEDLGHFGAPLDLEQHLLAALVNKLDGDRLVSLVVVDSTADLGSK